MNQLFFEKTESEEKAPSSTKDLQKRIETLFKTDPSVEREIQGQLASIVSQLYHAALNSQDG